MAWVLQSTKAEALRFKIMSFNRTTLKAKLVGDTGVPFERTLTQETLAKYGFRICEATEPACADA